MTVTPEFRSLRGEGVGLEYRYMASASARGDFYTRFFRDSIAGKDRAELQYHQIQSFSDAVTARMSLNYVTDQDYFRDLSVLTADRNQRSVESNFLLSARGENQAAYFLSRYTRDLTQAADNDQTLQKLPEIGYTYHATAFFPFPLYADFSSTATYFYRAVGMKAVRSDSYLRLMYEIPLSYLGILTPRAGLRKSYYSRSVSLDQSVERSISDLGAGFDTSLNRVYPGAEPLTHVFESSLVYEFVPPVDQSEIPQFDNLDFIPDKNILTYALTNRLIRREEIFYLKLTDSYLVNPKEGRFSDLRSEMMVRLWRARLKTDGYYNFYSGITEIFNLDLQTENPGRWMASLGERYSQSGSIPKKGDIFNPLSLGLLQDQPVPIRFLTSMFRFHLLDQWTVAAKVYYDYQNKIITEADYGLRYISKCWGINLGFVRFPEKSQVSFLLVLTGLGGGQSDSFRALFGD